MSASTYVVHKTDPPTPKQLYWVGKLAGDDKKREVESWTREAVSVLLNKLFEEDRARKRAASHTHAPYPAGRVIYAEESVAHQAAREAPTTIPTVILDMVPEGRYALRLDEAHPWVFFRVSRPDTQAFPKGTTKIQTQHGPNLKLCYVVWPDGKVSWYSRAFIEELKLLLVGHQRAAIDYGRKKRKCHMCGLDLTDKTSRKYATGSDCITTPRGQHMVAIIDALIASGELEDVDD